MQFVQAGKHTKLTNQALWFRWVAANALGEMIGLGSTFALIALVFTRWEEPQGAGMIVAVFLLAVASGGIEATVVGLAQWWAMHPWLPAISRRAWWLATLVGVLVAYVLGYLPSTLMNLADPAGQGSIAEPPQMVIMLLAAGLGAVGGFVLSFAQWLVMRKTTRRAGWWIPANMLAWLVGMPIIFWGIDLVMVQSSVAAVILLAGVLLLAGGVVGAIHGAFLVRMVR